MSTVHNELLSRALARVADTLAQGGDGWLAARRALDLARPDDPDVDESDAALAIELRDLPELQRLVAGWRSGEIPLPVADRAILARAMKAFKKRLKLTRLDEESTLGGRAMTGGRSSAITAVRPPEQYPAEVWDELVARGRMRALGGGLLEATEGGPL